MMRSLMNSNSLKLLQVRQILGNPYCDDTTKLRLLNNVVKNDFGKLTTSEAKRLVEIRRGFATCSSIGDKPYKSDRSLIRRGLAFYRVARKVSYPMMGGKPYRNRRLVITAVAERA